MIWRKRVPLLNLTKQDLGLFIDYSENGNTSMLSLAGLLSVHYRGF